MKLFENYNIILNQQQLAQLNCYYNLLVETNKQFNLTAITEHDEVYTKHFLDSMLGAQCIPNNATFCDVGAGAGFPSFPLKIYRPDISVTAVDSLNKRINFLNQVAETIDLDIQTVHSRAEDFASIKSLYRESFDVATARAVAPLNILLEYLAPLVKVGGIVLCYKTDESEQNSAVDAQKVLGLVQKDAICYTLPDESKRCLLVYSKIKSTPNKYPRSKNLPRTKPL